MLEEEISNIIAKMKDDLLEDTVASFGSGVPEEDIENCSLRDLLDQITEIKNFSDIYEYLTYVGWDVDDFLEPWSLKFDYKPARLELRDAVRVVEENSIIEQLSSDELGNFAKALVDWFERQKK